MSSKEMTREKRLVSSYQAFSAEYARMCARNIVAIASTIPPAPDLVVTLLAILQGNQRRQSVR
jgi:hypothetical protein